MKPSWVLSDDERNRRFNKLNKLNLKSVKPAAASQLRLPELYMTFTLEEHKLIDDLQRKFNFCKSAWLRNLLIFGRFVVSLLTTFAMTVSFLNDSRGGGEFLQHIRIHC